MKSKTVKQVLRKKFDEFAESITDEAVRKLVKKNSIITGGSIASMLLGEEVNDYDVYFTNRETVIAVCEYYIRKFSEGNPDRPSFYIMENGENISKDTNIADLDMFGGNTANFDGETFVPEGENSRIKIRVVSQGAAVEDGFLFDEADEPINSLAPVPGVTVPVDNLAHSEDTEDPGRHASMTNPNDIRYIGRKDDEPIEEEKEKFRPVYISSNAITLSDQFQLIIRFYGDADEIHSNYDFAHCTCNWTSDHGKLTLPSEALECLLTKELRYKGSKYPLASIIRTRKFINRGYTINAGQYLKMCLQLNDMNLRSLPVLEDQLVGVDAIYFAMMLAAIPEDQRVDGNIDSSYVITLIDKFF